MLKCFSEPHLATSIVVVYTHIFGDIINQEHVLGKRLQALV